MSVRSPLMARGGIIAACAAGGFLFGALYGDERTAIAGAMIVAAAFAALSDGLACFILILAGIGLAVGGLLALILSSLINVTPIPIFCLIAGGSLGAFLTMRNAGWRKASPAGLVAGAVIGMVLGAIVAFSEGDYEIATPSSVGRRTGILGAVFAIANAFVASTIEHSIIGSIVGAMIGTVAGTILSRSGVSDVAQKPDEAK